MTREDAIEILQGAIKKPNTKDGYLGQAIDMAIKALEQEPTTKNDLGVEDCVSRAEVLKLMKDNWHTHNGDWAMQESMDDIRALPSMTPQEPKTGHWNDISKYKGIAWYCSECERFTTMKHNYCPNCGAKMESEDV